MLRIGFILALLFLPSFGFSKVELDKEKWEKMVEELDYSKKDEPKKEDPEKENNEVYEKTQPSSNFSFAGIGQVLLVIVIVVLVALVVFMIANSRSNPALQRQNIALEKIDRIEEHIHDVDLDELVDQFKSENDFTMALRMSFLTIIKAMSVQGLIKWEKQKTNWEYHSEVSDFEMKTGFGQMILIFEKVWYGEFVLSESEFAKYQKQFENFKSKYVRVEKAA